MIASDMDASAHALDIYYRELARLADKIDVLTRSSFDDIKLLGGLGALIGWKPLLDLMTNQGSAISPVYLFLGFLVIALVLGIIGLVALMKQSVVLFYMRETQHYEAEIRKRLAAEETETFRVASTWKHWSNKTQRPLGKLFYIHFYLIVLFFPALVLVSGGGENRLSFLPAGWALAAIYILFAMAVCGIHYWATTRIVYTDENLGATKITRQP